jgi:hypothetical protein
MIKTVLAVLCFYSLIQGSLAQSFAAQTSPCKIKELLNRQGWEIPGLAKAIVKTHARYKAEGIPENVFIDIMESQAPEASFTYVGLKSCEIAVLNIRSVDVTKIERFTMNGHVFGYRVTGVIVGIDNQGHRIHAASEERAYFYDPDGSGDFSVMRYDPGDLIFRIIIPDWVKQAANPQPGPTKESP